jgi:hypothetical protein
LSNAYDRQLNNQNFIPTMVKIFFVVCFLLGNSPVSEFYMPMFRNTLSLPSSYSENDYNVVILHLSAYEDGTDRVFRNVGI